MRIVAVRERTIELSSATRNSSISFDAMTASVIAVHTDASKNGKPLVGLAFDSDRPLRAWRAAARAFHSAARLPPIRAIMRDGNGGIDPHRAWAVLMKDEKPGGHGERCGAVGLIDAALWDLAAKAADEPLWSLLARRHGNGQRQRQDRGLCQRRPLSRCERRRRPLRRRAARHRARAIAASRSRSAARARPPTSERIEAVFSVLERGMSLAVDGNGTFDRAKAIQYLDALKPYPLAWIEEPVHPLDFELHSRHRGAKPDRARDRRKPVLARRCAQSSALRRAAQGPRRSAIRHFAELWHRRVSAHPRLSRRAGLAPRALRAACRTSAGDECRRRPRAWLGRGRDGHLDSVRKADRRRATQRRRRDAAGCARRRLRAASPFFPKFSAAVELSCLTRNITWNSRPRLRQPTKSASLVRPDHVHRRAYADAAVFQLEQERIFSRLWIYVAHESQLKKPGDFVRTRLAAYEILVTRHTDGNIYVLQNRCPHRGARICMVDRGNAKVFSCPYHAWSFRPDGIARLGAAPQELSAKPSASTIRRTICSGSAVSPATAASCSPH